MHRVTAVPGLLFVTLLYIGWPPSFDVSTTVPARNSLFEFVVELEKAEKTPNEATAPTAPTTSMVSRALRVREVWVMGVLLRVPFPRTGERFRIWTPYRTFVHTS